MVVDRGKCLVGSKKREETNNWQTLENDKIKRFKQKQTYATILRSLESEENTKGGAAWYQKQSVIQENHVTQHTCRHENGVVRSYDAILRAIGGHNRRTDNWGEPGFTDMATLIGFGQRARIPAPQRSSGRADET
jgi:hypothetical protein